MSSNASEKQKTQCINSGMSDHIDKPISFFELRTLLLKWTAYRADFSAKEIIEISSDQFPPFSQPRLNKLSYDT